MLHVLKIRIQIKNTNEGLSILDRKEETTKLIHQISMLEKKSQHLRRFPSWLSWQQWDHNFFSHILLKWTNVKLDNSKVSPLRIIYNQHQIVGFQAANVINIMPVMRLSKKQTTLLLRIQNKTFLSGSSANREKRNLWGNHVCGTRLARRWKLLKNGEIVTQPAETWLLWTITARAEPFVSSNFTGERVWLILSSLLR